VRYQYPIPAVKGRVTWVTAVTLPLGQRLAYRTNDQRPVSFALRSCSHLPPRDFRLFTFRPFPAGRSLVAGCCIPSFLPPNGTGVTAPTSLPSLTERSHPRCPPPYQLIFTLFVREYGYRCPRPSARRSILRDELLGYEHLQPHATDSCRRLPQWRWTISLNETATEPKAQP
jgi:hypothetical protein